ncbi:hypothetical protein NEISUBOT_03300 [Neisseria subflava NJ9703]|uniref:Uncharacterized protein n=1 Tax=Neisseria subflava NJ9703 TaxID=546268 RepID=A0A9W5ITA8_NEISU|nr:hypothetical protein NEISUBOT_03300 [Neisseria subflava NJ9703]
MKLYSKLFSPVAKLPCIQNILLTKQPKIAKIPRLTEVQAKPLCPLNRKEIK